MQKRASTALGSEEIANVDSLDALDELLARMDGMPDAAPARQAPPRASVEDPLAAAEDIISQLEDLNFDSAPPSAQNTLRPPPPSRRAPPPTRTPEDDAIATADDLLAQLDAGLSGGGGGFSLDDALLGLTMNDGSQLPSRPPPPSRGGTIVIPEIKPSSRPLPPSRAQSLAYASARPQGSPYATTITMDEMFDSLSQSLHQPARTHDALDDMLREVSNAGEVDSLDAALEAAARSLGTGQIAPKEADSYNDIDDEVLQYVQVESATKRYKLYQDDLEWELYNEIMSVRKDPRFYAKLLYSTYRPYYQGRVLRMPGAPGMMTIEGQAACDECIKFLASVEPCATELKRNMGLCLAAKEAYDDIAPTGSTEYANAVSRVTKYGTLGAKATDICGYGGEDARMMMILSFLICDGDPTRARRNIIFDPVWKLMGVAAGPHSSPYKIMGLVVFASDYTSNLEMMKLSPFFREKTTVEIREEVAELVDTFKQLAEANLDPDDEANDSAARLRAAAIAISGATSKMLDSEGNSIALAQKKFAENLQALEGTEESTGENNDFARLRGAAVGLSNEATRLFGDSKPVQKE